MKEHIWKNGKLIPDERFTVIQRSITEYRAEKLTQYVWYLIDAIICGIAVTAFPKDVAYFALYLCLAATVPVIVYNMSQKKINKLILDKDFKWRDTASVSAIDRPSIKKFRFGKRIILDDGLEYKSLQNISDFETGQSVTVICIGNDGEKYVFSKKLQQGEK